MPDCRTCQANKQKPVFKKDISTARATRLFRYIVISFTAIIIALAISLAVTIITVNNKWAETVQKTNDKWAEYLGECDVYDISYDQDGNGVADTPAKTDTPAVRGTRSTRSRISSEKHPTSRLVRNCRGSPDG